MTHELVYANITYVMEDERRKQTEQNLIKSGGSRYDGFRKQIDSQMQAAFTSYFTKFMGKSPDPELIRILVAMRLCGYMELVKGDYTVQERVRLAKEIGIHADAGTISLIKYLKENSEAYRR